MSLVNLSLANVIAWLLAAFFFIGAYGNTFVSPEIAADYARWGYPESFRYLTAVCEFTAAVMLIVKPLRLYGSLLGSAVMLAAVATVLFHGEYAHAVPPMVVLGFCGLVARLTARRKPVTLA
ncbi:DoxX family protein [Rhizobium anhuiense]|uniref:DoxX family protein n=1 Tax=Rhizobium anhuiense TaxID=1184720 RepID=UPI0014427A21|nr:DoxX family protein [Rhizobium anhuiense]NKM57647.1 DoxX family protein [Rhizobium anhuiense]